jgi:hypothetical protein
VGHADHGIEPFVLWFDNFAMRHFPKWISDAATALHFYEAILATSAIAIWHMYTVISDPDVYPMDFSWLTGKISVEHLRRMRPGYCDELVKGGRAATASDKNASTERESANSL